jgi:hypothetical protein
MQDRRLNNARRPDNARLRTALYVTSLTVGTPPRLVIAFRRDFLDIARLQEPNPLLYRCFPLTCARSQE